MLSVNLPKNLEKRFLNIVQESYKGDLNSAITSFLKLHKKYGWKKQLLKDIHSVQSEVKREGGIKIKTIDNAIKKYREKIGT